ncbi:uncharacterized protein CCOS01_13962, partial [Colletotrichum costaricense]
HLPTTNQTAIFVPKATVFYGRTHLLIHAARTNTCRLAMAYSLRILLLSIVKDPGQTEALQDVHDKLRATPRISTLIMRLWGTRLQLWACGSIPQLGPNYRQPNAGGEGVGTLGGSSPQLWKTHSEIYHAVHRQPDMTGSRVGTQRL